MSGVASKDDAVGQGCACRFNDKYELTGVCKFHGDVIVAAVAVSRATFSHVNGRDLLAEIHPRRTLDILRRVDGRETMYEGDWLSTLFDARKKLDEALMRIGQNPRPERPTPPTKVTTDRAASWNPYAPKSA